MVSAVSCDSYPALSGCLRVWQKKIRFENEKYLRAHPELAQISTVLISEVLVSQPGDPVKFVAQYTTQEGFKNRVLKAASTIGVNS